jgi:hypothetical protein
MGMQVIEYTETTVEEIDGYTVETHRPRTAKVIPLRASDREWLMRDCMSAPYATILED